MTTQIKTYQGGTGVTTVTGLLKGNGTSPFTGIALPADATKYLDGTGNFSTPGGGSGTVTTVSVSSTNGFAGTVANATTTPAITLSTSITGLLKGNGTAISAATAGTDYAGITTANVFTNTQTISTAPLIISGNQSQSAWTTNGTQLSIAAATLTDTTSSGTVATMGVNTFASSTINSTSSTTYTNASTVYIGGAPIQSGNATITTSYAFYVNTGRSYLGGGMQTSLTTASSNFAASGTTITTGSTASALLFAGATSISYRAIFSGSTASTLTTGQSYSNIIVGSSPITTFSSGTHALLANLVVNPLGTVTNGGATTTATASLYINGAGSGGATNYSLWNVGQTRFDLGSDATGDIFYRASTGVFTRLAIGATGTHLVVSGGLPSWTAQTGVSNYTHTIFTPTTGQTITAINNQYNIVNPAGAILALTVNLPSSPANNDVVYIKFTQAVTTVTYANGTVVDGIVGPVAGTLVVLTYDSGTTSWY